MITRRRLLGEAGLAGLAMLSSSARAETTVKLALPDGVDARPITRPFRRKARWCCSTTAPLLETPFEVFDQGVLTPNERFFVRWHWPLIPTRVNVDTFRLNVHGHVDRMLSLSLEELMALPQFEIAAVNQCSGNSRGFFEPRVAGGEWGNGAMGNARWSGVRLKDVLDRAGVKTGAVEVRLSGLDAPPVADAPRFIKSLAIDHARDSEVMIAYAMNGNPLPLLNGFPLRVVVPGWYGTYWVKMLSDIKVLDQPDTNFWMKSAYLIPDTPGADIKPGDTNVKMVPISRMNPRSFITNIKAGSTLHAGASTLVRGIAFGGDTGVKRVDFSPDGGNTWEAARRVKDEGKYGFRHFEAPFRPASTRATTLMARCTNDNGVMQPDRPNWNPAGFMRNVIESIPVSAA